MGAAASATAAAGATNLRKDQDVSSGLILLRLYRPGGGQIAFHAGATGQPTSDIWAMENFLPPVKGDSQVANRGRQTSPGAPCRRSVRKSLVKEPNPPKIVE